MDTPYAETTTRAPAVLIKAVQLPHLKHLYLVRLLLVIKVFFQAQFHHCQTLSVLHSRFGLDIDIVLSVESSVWILLILSLSLLLLLLLLFCVHIDVEFMEKYLSSPRAESARAVTGRRWPHSGRGEDFLSRQPDFFTETAVTSERKVEKSFPRWEINRHDKG